MSRGFVKEDDLEHAGTNLPERPVSTHVNYVTPEGLQQLEQAVDQLAQERQALYPKKDDPITSQRLSVVERDLRYFQARLDTMVVVDSHQQSGDTVLFGATVIVEDENGEQQTFKIVGEDEANISDHKVSYVSPIATALIGRKVGDSVFWQRPVGNLTLEIIAIHY